MISVFVRNGARSRRAAAGSGRAAQSAAARHGAAGVGGAAAMRGVAAAGTLSAAPSSAASGSAREARLVLLTCGGVSERSEHSERSEFRRTTPARAAQGSRCEAPTAAVSVPGAATPRIAAAPPTPAAPCRAAALWAARPLPAAARRDGSVHGVRNEDGDFRRMNRRSDCKGAGRPLLRASQGTPAKRGQAPGAPAAAGLRLCAREPLHATGNTVMRDEAVRDDAHPRRRPRPARWSH